jgi:hypothetical protein
MSHTDQLSQWFGTLSRRLEALGEWEQRSILLADQVQQIDTTEASAFFSRVLASAFVNRSPRVIITAESALLAALNGDWPAAHRSRAREAAAAVDDDLTLRFLSSGAGPLVDADDEDSIPIPDYGGDRPLTLGERKTLASRPTREVIERAMLDPHPMVAIKLLSNPKLVEEDVIRMAARRPGPPAVLAQIALHPRWRRRRRVALALVYNSYLPTWYGLSLLPWLDAHEAAAVAADSRLADEIRSGAEALLSAKDDFSQLW